ncbi:class I SAM-dependent methyltransferase [Variovorax sp. VaC1]|uniref:class I SAM-dependent methyltransferase n=1 Tax=Variovorax sp. VaC1 TaxID=3373132 RepID=UPI003748A14C
MSSNDSIDFLSHNRAAWDRQATEEREWSRPVSSELIAAARHGDWRVHLTPQPLPADWLGDVRGRRILCLASAGGQQAPVLAAAGAQVTVFDLSDEQLMQDRRVAERDGLDLATVQGDMRDLGVFADAQFDIVFHPISNLYVPDVRPVWRECHRVLKAGGALLASFYNPVVFIGDRDPALLAQGLVRPLYKLPYSDLGDLPPEALEKKRQNGEAMVFGHSLADLIGGQIATGFSIDGFLEDAQPHPRFVVDRFMPTFLATRAVKRQPLPGATP